MTTYFGYVAITGKPNVGKSTLLNQWIGKQLAITTAKPQTTRHQILGVKTDQAHQLALLDTPGLQAGPKPKLNQYLNKVAVLSYHEANLILFLTKAGSWQLEDQKTLMHLVSLNKPIIWVINQIDRIDEIALEQYLLKYNHKKFQKVLPISAKKKVGLSDLLETVKFFLPEGTHQFSPDQISNRPESFHAEEGIREACLFYLSEEIPYQIHITLTSPIEKNAKGWHIQANIHVQKTKHRSMVIGHQGQMIKTIGIRSRKKLSQYFNQPVHLKLMVHVDTNPLPNHFVHQSLSPGFPDIVDHD
ncbi:GTPase Era [Gammaproteobacteria bacterium]|nr:GTPase Era [Gammaproteobacteria bacterium]